MPCKHWCRNPCAHQRCVLALRCCCRRAHAVRGPCCRAADWRCVLSRQSAPAQAGTQPTPAGARVHAAPRWAAMWTKGRIKAFLGRVLCHYWTRRSTTDSATAIRPKTQCISQCGQHDSPMPHAQHQQSMSAAALLAGVCSRAYCREILRSLSASSLPRILDDSPQFYDASTHARSHAVGSATAANEAAAVARNMSNTWWGHALYCARTVASAC